MSHGSAFVSPPSLSGRGWWGGPPAPAELHYPSIKPELVGLIDALHGIGHEAERRAKYLADRATYAERFRLTPDQRAALVVLDHKAIVAMGTHPLLPFLGRMQVDRTVTIPGRGTEGSIPGPSRRESIANLTPADAERPCRCWIGNRWWPGKMGSAAAWSWRRYSGVLRNALSHICRSAPTPVSLDGNRLSGV